MNIRQEIENLVNAVNTRSKRERDNTFEAKLKMLVKVGDKVFTIFPVNTTASENYPPELLEFVKDPVVFDGKWVLPFSWQESAPFKETVINRNWLKHLFLARQGRDKTHPVNQGYDHW